MFVDGRIHAADSLLMNGCKPQDTNTHVQTCLCICSFIYENSILHTHVIGLHVSFVSVRVCVFVFIPSVSNKS